MTKYHLLFIVFYLVLASGPYTIACTSFCLQDESTLLCAKNLDWPVGDGFIFVNGRGVAKQTPPLESGETIKWVSRYASITFNQFGRGFPLGGMNEAGLVVEELSYSPSRYPEPDDRSAIPEMQWIQYQLDNCSTVQQVIDSDSFLRPIRLIAHLHYIVADLSGAVAVIEFLDGRMVTYPVDQSVPVLSNNSYDNSIRYLQRHLGFGGDRVVSSGPESQERFVRAATLLKQKESMNNRENINYAFDILENVSQNDTQWSIVYDLHHQNIYFKCGHSDNRATINLTDLVENDDASLFLPIESCNGEVNTLFESCNSVANQTLVKRVFEKLIELEEMEDQTGQSILSLLLSYQEERNPQSTLNDQPSE